MFKVGTIDSIFPETVCRMEVLLSNCRIDEIILFAFSMYFLDDIPGEVLFY